MSTEGSVEYLHGYRSREQSRLRKQARILSGNVIRNVEFPPGSRVLEVGCGVGAQSELLLESFPSIQLTAIDISATQIAGAKKRFKSTPYSSRVEFLVADGKEIPFPSKGFDGAFLCWFLEHVNDPLAALKELFRCLKPGAVVHINEVFNLLHYVGPSSTYLKVYWNEYNRLQRELGGDPEVGVKLGTLLAQAGFTQVKTELNTEHWDVRHARERRWMCSYWNDLLMSAAPELVRKGRVSPSQVQAVKEELQEAAVSDDGILFFGWMKASAKK